MKKYTLLSFLIIIISCGDSDPKELTYSELIDRAWTQFDSRNFEQAISTFSDAKNKDNSQVDAFTGLAWSYLMNDQAALALTEFLAGIEINSSEADLHAGLSYYYGSQDQFVLAVDEINITLELDSLWQFDYGLDLDKDDLIVAKAIYYFLLEDYANSLLAIQILLPNLNPNLSTDEGIDELSDAIESFNSGLSFKVSFKD